MSVKEKLISAKNAIVSNIKQNGKVYLTGAALGFAGGTLFVLKAVIERQNNLEDRFQRGMDVVNHNANASNWSRSHPYYIEKKDDGTFITQIIELDSYDNPSTEEK